jgi:hypothetical protein
MDYRIGAEPFPTPGWIILPGWYFWPQPWPSFHPLTKWTAEFACRWKQRKVPDWKDWDYLKDHLSWYSSDLRHPEDVALMLYYYYTNRRPVDAADYARVDGIYWYPTADDHRGPN